MSKMTIDEAINELTRLIEDKDYLGQAIAERRKITIVGPGDCLEEARKIFMEYMRERLQELKDEELNCTDPILRDAFDKQRGE